MLTAVDYLPLILKGALITLQITAGGIVVALIVAFAAGLGRLSRWPAMRWAATLFIEFFRGTSVYVQLFWAYFVLPLFGFSLTSMQAGILILGMNSGAYAAEIVRGAILAVPREQIEACTALNLNTWQRMRHVVLPQALVMMLPPFSNSAIELLKGTSVVSLIALTDMTFTAQVIRSQTGETALPFITILVIYFVMAMALAQAFRLAERRLSRNLDTGPASGWSR